MLKKSICTRIKEFLNPVSNTIAKDDNVENNRFSFEIYQDKSGEYRWRFVAGNGEIVAVSSEGYKVKKFALDSLSFVKSFSKTAKSIDLTSEQFL